MTIVLRDYQNTVVTATGQALRRNRRVLVVVPPGGGKTVIAAFMAQAFAARGQTAFFNCHRQELIKQTSGTFADCGLEHSFIAAGQPMYVNAAVQICSIDTLKNRLAKLQEPKVVFWDECHHIAAAGWSAIMEAWPNSYHIGLTGSPWRLDGSGLGRHFDEMILGPSTAELIEMGKLAPYEIFAPSTPDMKGVRKSMGDFAKADAEQKMREPKIIGDIVNHWKKHASGLLTVGYAVNVAHSQYMSELFNQNGIPAAHLDGGTENSERKRIIQKYADGDIKVLWNVGLFGEGFDLSAWAGKPVTIDAAILANPTTSLSKYLQESMRCMRPREGKTAIILDHAGNSSRHGFPDDDRDWQLEDRKKGKKSDAQDGPPPPLTCDGCYRQWRRPAPAVCTCGKHLVAEAKEIEVGEGELKKLTEADKQRVRANRKREEAECKSLEDWISLGRQRGYDFPLQWAQKRHGLRANRR
jgi:superfamily II DNA or RNA helicase